MFNFNNGGFNMSSPIVQNMLGGNNIPPNNNSNQYINYQQPMQQPQQLINPFTSTGNFNNPNPNPLGFNYQNMPNSPFYNNLFGNYYNPYMGNNNMNYNYQQQYERARRIDEWNRAQEEAKVWKTISRGINSIIDNGIEDIEEHVKQYDPIDYNAYVRELKEQCKPKQTLKVRLVKGDEIICDPIANGYYENEEKSEQYSPNAQYMEYVEVREYNRLVSADLYGIPYNVELARIVERNNQIYDRHKAEFGDDVGIIEFLNRAGSLYAEALMFESQMRAMDMKTKYDPNSFASRINSNKKHQMEDYFSTCFFGGPPEVTGMRATLGGNLEVTVPNHIRNKYEERRAQFLQTILSQ